MSPTILRVKGPGVLNQVSYIIAFGTVLPVRGSGHRALKPWEVPKPKGPWKAIVQGPRDAEAKVLLPSPGIFFPRSFVV